MNFLLQSHMTTLLDSLATLLSRQRLRIPFKSLIWEISRVAPVSEQRVAEHDCNISRCAVRLSSRFIGVGTGNGRGEGLRKGRNAGGKAGSIFKCTDLLQICACLPYRAVTQYGCSFKHTHHQDMSKFDHHRFSTNLNSAVLAVVSWFLSEC